MFECGKDDEQELDDAVEGEAVEDDGDEGDVAGGKPAFGVAHGFRVVSSYAVYSVV